MEKLIFNFVHQFHSNSRAKLLKNCHFLQYLKLLEFYNYKKSDIIVVSVNLILQIFDFFINVGPICLFSVNWDKESHVRLCSVRLVVKNKSWSKVWVNLVVYSMVVLLVVRDWQSFCFLFLLALATLGNATKNRNNPICVTHRPILWV